MSRFLVCAAMLGAGLALPACNREQPPANQQPQAPLPSAGLFARGMQQLVGQQMGPLRIASVAAEGNVLVVTLDGATGWRAETSPAGINEAFLTGYCRNPNAAVYFADGRTMRVDTMENGQGRIQGTPIDRCPAAQ